MRVAVIGGTGFYDPEIIEGAAEKRMANEYGTASVLVGEYGKAEVIFMPRHGKEHSVPPHKINYRANIEALRQLEVDHVLATTAVGSLNEDMPPGDLVLLDQFLDFTKNRTYTFFDGGEHGVIHVDVTHPYCPSFRERILAAAKKSGLSIHPRGCYICTEGPRFETPAEIQMFRGWGADVVGMTNVPEAVLAAEAGLCYAVVSMVTNWAAGLKEGGLTHEEHLRIMGENRDEVITLLRTMIEELQDKDTDCDHEPPKPL